MTPLALIGLRNRKRRINPRHFQRNLAQLGQVEMLESRLYLHNSLSAPVITDVTSDTGVPGDHLTSDNTLTVLGTAGPRTHVSVYFNGVYQGYAGADFDGHWSFDAGAKSDGVYRITAEAHDHGHHDHDDHDNHDHDDDDSDDDHHHHHHHHSAPSRPYVMTIDHTAPAAPVITSFSDDTGTPGDRITADNTLRIRGTAEANSTVNVFFNEVSQGTTITDANGNWMFDAAAKSDGVYAVSATARDVAGNSSGESGYYQVTIDRTAPSAPVITSFSDDTGTPDDRITSDNTLRIRGTAEANSTVSVFFNEVSQGTTITDANGNWMFDAAAKSDGVYAVSAMARDAAGNSGGESDYYQVTIDTRAPSAPTITGFSDDTGTAGDKTTSDDTLRLAGTAESGSTVTVFFNGTSQGSAITDASGQWVLDAPAHPDGVYVITASARDAAGNNSSPSNALQVTIDTVAPPTPFVTVDGGQVQQGSAEANTTVTAYLNGTAQATTTVSADGSWSMVLPQSPHKGDTVTFDSHDIAGNPSGKSGAATKAPPVCLPPSVDTDFNPVTGSKTTNRLLVVRERAYEVSPDLTLYGAPGTHTYVQSLLFHTRDNERDGEVTAATITFSPGVTILATITSTRLLGGARGDRVATFSDAMFGIFGDPKTRNTNWNKYAGKDRGLEKRGDRFEVINDGRDGQPARIELEFPTTVGPDQSRVIIDYGDCWAANVSVNVEFHTPRQNKVYHKYTQYQGRVLGSPSPNGAPAAGNGPGLVLTPQVAPPTIDNLSDDTGPSATDRVTSDNTPELSGTSLANSSVRLTLNGALVDTVLADDTGRWSYLSPTLAPGNYSVEAASAVDDAISSMSDPFRFTITDL